jgi:hypothetical protein
MIQGPSRRVTMSLQQPISRDSSVWRLAGLALSLTVVLLSQFVLDGAADASTMVHWIQHGLLFGGGVGTGLALNAIRSAGQGRA